MRITTNADACLILEDRSWLRGLILIAAILFGVSQGMRLALAGVQFGLAVVLITALAGSFFFMYVIERREVLFLRDLNQLTIRQRTLLGYSAKTYPLSDLSHAETIEQTPHTQSKASTVTLVMRNDRIALAPQSLSAMRAALLAKSINEWLRPES